jgi:hypothetical protein
MSQGSQGAHRVGWFVERVQRDFAPAPVSSNLWFG